MTPEERQVHRQHGKSRAQALLGTKPREFRSEDQFNAARRAAQAIGGEKAAKKFDEDYAEQREKLRELSKSSNGSRSCSRGGTFDRSASSPISYVLYEGDRGRHGTLTKHQLFKTDMAFSKAGDRPVPIVMDRSVVGEVGSMASRFGNDGRLELKFSGVANEPAKKALARGGFCFIEDNGKLALEICG